MDSMREGKEENMEQRIGELKKRLGKDLFIPVHHYQKDEIVRFSDCTGDSLELSKAAAATDAKFIAFCGVRFMAETAKVLAKKNQMVFMPRPDAGCPLADFGSLPDIRKVWNTLEGKYPGEYIPVTYVNSSVELKAFCGDRGGLTCTSSNAKRIIRSVLENGKRLFFMPDRNLGINTVRALNEEDDSEVVGATDKTDAVLGRRIVIWNGYCYVHRAFRPDHVRAVRKRYPGVTVIVHPECDPEVAERADLSGSTATIQRVVSEAEAGSKWAVGTEATFVYRLQKENDDKLVLPLLFSVCEDMSRSETGDLHAVLERIAEGDYGSQVTVPDSVTEGAKLAIVRMLEM
ncbi:MAG: quinolinate synthase NadA [Spirochaetes bacterium]|nr:quinolinate synthase NadA [Spirochaetota bacterium]